jgi:hypothetical protein
MRATVRLGGGGTAAGVAAAEEAEGERPRESRKSSPRWIKSIVEE